MEVVLIQRKKKNIDIELTVNALDTLLMLKQTIVARPESEKKNNSLRGSLERSLDDRELRYSVSNMKIFSNGMEYKDDTKTLLDLEFFDDQTIYAFLVDENDDDDDDFEVAINEVLKETVEEEGNKKGSARAKRKMKKRSIDSSWLEAMQQQLHGTFFVLFVGFSFFLHFSG